VHYIQAKYFDEDLSTDGCEVQAAEVQRWFREEYVLPKLDVAAGVPNATPGCSVVQSVDGTRSVRCVAGSRAAPG
jgi:hypothetical protein